MVGGTRSAPGSEYALMQWIDRPGFGAPEEVLLRLQNPGGGYEPPLQEAAALPPPLPAEEEEDSGCERTFEF